MPPKRKSGGSKAKKEKIDPTISRSQALQLKNALAAGHSLDKETILTLLNSATPCAGLYSKSCKVRAEFS